MSKEREGYDAFIQLIESREFHTPEDKAQCLRDSRRYPSFTTQQRDDGWYRVNNIGQSNGPFATCDEAWRAGLDMSDCQAWFDAYNPGQIGKALLP